MNARWLAATALAAGWILSGSAALAQDVELRIIDKTPFGAYLTGADGKSLYLFTPDAGTGSTCYDNCATNWPPLIGAVKAGEGVDPTLIGTTERTDGTSQVTYNGWPLYYYAKDMAQGDTTGQEAGDKWYLISPVGAEIRGGQ